MTWRFYDPATGIMLRKRLVCQRSQLAANTPAGMLPIPGDFDPLSQRVDITAEPPEPVPQVVETVDPVTGAVTQTTLPPAEWWPPVVDYQPPAPADDELRTWAWDAGTKRWVSTPTLLAIKKAKAQELAQARDAEFRGGMTVGAFTVPTDSDSVSDYMLLRQTVAENDWQNTQIKLADGTYQVITQAQATALWAALKTHRRTLLDKLNNKAALVQAATTAAAVAAITWTSTP